MTIENDWPDNSNETFGNARFSSSEPDTEDWASHEYVDYQPVPQHRSFVGRVIDMVIEGGKNLATDGAGFIVFPSAETPDQKDQS